MKNPIPIDHCHLTNTNLMQTDFAAADRQKFLRLRPRRVRSKRTHLAPGLPARGIWMTDVSAMDRRSVKAQLAGRAGWRVTWWAWNCRLHAFLRPQASLEQTMYAFHQRHHALTLGWLQHQLEGQAIYLATKYHGPLAGLRCALEQIQQSIGETR
jgi:hypothetical protein